MQKRIGLDISATLVTAYHKWGKYAVLDALNAHFSDIRFPGDSAIYKELLKMFSRRSYFPLRNSYTVYIEEVLLSWLIVGVMNPDPTWYNKLILAAQ